MFVNKLFIFFRTAYQVIYHPLDYFSEKHFGAFFEAGWIVLFCLLAVIIALVAVAVCHERTRKQISGRCCRKYGALTTDGDHDVTSVLVEGHHVEQAARDTISE